MPRTSFAPRLHGFRFRNEFSNKAVSMIPMHGACGGMSYAALDYFHAGQAVPSFEETPPNSSVLGRYIWDRHWDSTVRSWHATTHAALSLGLDDEALAWRTRCVEWAKLRAAIDSGRTVVLGLIGWGRVPRPNHQVIAYGYSEAPQSICVYDNRVGPEEVRLIDDPRCACWWSPTPARVGSGHAQVERWRGWFVESGYWPRTPVGAVAPPRRATLALSSSADRERP
jgi:hypothetical protein